MEIDQEWRSWRKGIDDWRTTVDTRLTAIETELHHVATKADLANLKLWMVSTILTGVLGAVGLAKLIF